MNEENEPLMLPNGMIYGRLAINLLTENDEIICPRTKEKFHAKDVKRVYVMWSLYLQDSIFQIMISDIFRNKKWPVSCREIFGFLKSSKKAKKVEIAMVLLGKKLYGVKQYKNKLII